jgi:IS5 family transposase
MANNPRKYIEKAERGLFDGMERMAQIDNMNDPLANLNAVMDWEIFHTILDTIPKEQAKGPGGRPAFEPIYMFKILVLQSLYNLSDEQTQFQILDRRSFHRFLNISEADIVPDQNTIREFREKLTKAKLFETLFVRFNEFLAQRGFITQKGNLVDASFVEVPRQRNKKDENEAIKKGEVPEGWENDHKRLSHKDLDARWAKKNNDVFYGYKNHVSVDLESKLITRCVVTDASVHDSQVLDQLTKQGDAETWLDAGYAGAECEKILAEKSITAQICAKGNRGKKLSKSDKKKNRKKSKTRARVEHVFAFMTVSMNAMRKRFIGRVRNEAAIIFSNIVYNMARVEQIIRLRLLGRMTPKHV